MPQCRSLVGTLVATVKTNNKHFTFIICYLLLWNYLLHEVTFLVCQYDSTKISFCTKIEYSASMTQKHGLD